MRLDELIQDPMVAKLKNAIDVMLVRSKTIGKPYHISYDQLAHLVNFRGTISKADIEAAMNNDPTLASEISDLDDTGIVVDSAHASEAPAPSDDMSDLGDLGDLGLDTPPDTSGAPVSPTDISAPPMDSTDVDAVDSDEDKEQVKRIDTVQKM